mgnify:CR=1 FL=1
MAIKDQVVTNRSNIISIILCRDIYGHNNQVANLFFWHLLNYELTDSEIVEYAEVILSYEGCEQKDYDLTIESLTEWRNSRNS